MPLGLFAVTEGRQLILPRTADPDVLLVEDNASTATVMAALMRSVGVSVQIEQTVRTGIAALTKMPAVVVIDLKLPDGNGFEILKTIRTTNLRCKTAIISAATDLDLFKSVRQLKPDAVFGKPLDFEEFAQWLCESFPPVPIAGDA